MRTQDERTMAMLAHGSALLNLVSGIGGIIVALVIYFVQKEKSAWVAFQALQSLIFQVIVVVVSGILLVLSSILVTVFIGCLCLPVALLLGLAGIGYSAYGAYQTYQGVDFRYYWLGDWLAAQMPPGGATPPAGPTPPVA